MLLTDAAFLANPAGCGLHCHGGSLLRRATGGLMAAWYAYPEVEHANATIVLARRPSGATRWRDARTPLTAPQTSAGNPVLFEESSGRVWLLFVLLAGPYWTDAVVHGAWSDDDGDSWSPPAQLMPVRGLMIRHPPVMRSDGTWLLPAYDERRLQSVLLAARPPFGDWNELYRFDDAGLIQPVLVRTPDGLTLLFRPARDPRVVWRSHSTDEGRRWSAPLRTSLPNPLTGISAVCTGDRLAVVYNHTTRHERRPLSLATSDDGGRDWSAPWRIDDMAGELSYPSFVPAPDGGLHGLYSYNRRLIKYVRLGAGPVG